MTTWGRPEECTADSIPLGSNELSAWKSRSGTPRSLERHPRTAPHRNPVDRAGGRTLGRGEQTSPDAGGTIREVGIKLCLKESDGSEYEKYEKKLYFETRMSYFV